MAIYGVLADIHGNREALVAALAALETRSLDYLICAGDIIGFNADPNGCVDLLREREIPAVAGNHDLIGIGRLGFSRCANKVIYSLKRTRRLLTPKSVSYLSALPLHRMVEDQVLLTHAGIRDVEQYVRSPAQVLQNAAHLRAEFPQARICLFGHIHEQRVFEVNGDMVQELPAKGVISLRHDRTYFVNPGSIDAARKRGERRAEWALLDTGGWTVEFQSAPYDHGLSEAKAVDGGYRIGPVVDRLYTLRRRLGARYWPEWR